MRCRHHAIFRRTAICAALFFALTPRRYCRFSTTVIVVRFDDELRATPTRAARRRAAAPRAVRDAADAIVSSTDVEAGNAIMFASASARAAAATRRCLRRERSVIRAAYDTRAARDCCARRNAESRSGARPLFAMSTPQPFCDLPHVTPPVDATQRYFEDARRHALTLR